MLGQQFVHSSKRFSGKDCVVTSWHLYNLNVNETTPTDLSIWIDPPDSKFMFTEQGFQVILFQKLKSQAVKKDKTAVFETEVRSQNFGGLVASCWDKSYSLTLQMLVVDVAFVKCFRNAVLIMAYNFSSIQPVETALNTEKLQSISN